MLGSIKPEDVVLADTATAERTTSTPETNSRISFVPRIVFNTLALLAADALALWLSSQLVLEVRNMLPIAGLRATYEQLWLQVWIGMWLMFGVINGLYPSYGFDLTEQIKRTTSVFSATLLSCLAAYFLTQNEAGFSRVLLLVGGLVAVPLSLTLRRLVTLILVKLGGWGVPVLVVGDSEIATQLVRTLQSAPALGYRPKHYPIDQLNWAAPPSELANIARIAFIADPHMPYRQREAIIAGPLAGFRQVFLTVDTPALDIGWADARYLGSVRVLELRRLHLDPTELRVKRVLDLIASFVLLIPIGLLMLMLAILIRLDSPGPVFYAGERLGLRGRPFRCLKFRTMRLDAEERLQEMLEKDPALKAEYTAFHKLRNDPRVTRVGEFLRRTSLDELPQIINILLGHMSLVGPRPYLLRERELMHPYTDAVLSCRPGLTGWWQVEARNSARFDERLQMDIFYIRRWSIWLDLHILVRTVMVVLQGRGAY